MGRKVLEGAAWCLEDTKWRSGGDAATARDNVTFEEKLQTS